MTKNTNEHGFISAVYEGKTYEDLHTCLFAYFLSQEEPKRIVKALSDPAWVEAMQEELLQFKLQKVWILVGNLTIRIEAIRLFLAYASFMGYMVYQMDMKSAFLYGTIEEEVYVCQPLGFKDLDYPNKAYKVVKALYGLNQAPKAWKASILMDTEKPLLKDTNGEDVDVHLYRSMIGSLRYLKGQPKLGLWYPRNSPFDLVAYSDSDYAIASLDRKSTTGGCHFLGCRLISWQCKKQTMVATSSTEAEYVAAASCCGQVLWIQNQMLDYRISTAKHIEYLWLWKNKRDEENTVIRNKSRLVAKGYAQKEGIDFEESFAPVARNLYVNQPDGFVDPYHPDKVYRLKKALYGLKQAPRAWYDELSNFLVSKGFSKGMTSCDSIGTPMATKHLEADLSGTLVDQTKYHSMVGALMYLTTKIELTLEQSQQGVSNDVLVSIEGVEELKRNVWIKGEKKEALLTP
ncbi:putative ribonuclease H-like domain-containing protein [Tanacetum coccineum]